MDRKVIDLKDAPEVLQKRVNRKMSHHGEDANLLQVIQTEHRYLAYLSIGNLCMILSVWNFNHDEVNEDTMTVGEIKEFMNHPLMKMWFP